MLFLGVSLKYIKIQGIVNSRRIQLSFLIVPRFSFTDFLKSLIRYRVTHLLLVVSITPIVRLLIWRFQPRSASSGPFVQGVHPVPRINIFLNYAPVGISRRA